MNRSGLTDDFCACGILAREHIERVLIKAEAQVIGSDLKDALGIRGQVCHQARVALTQPNAFVTQK